MPNPTTTVDRPRNAVEHKVTLEERTWNLANDRVDEHLREAHGLVSKRPNPSRERLVHLAHQAAIESLAEIERAGSPPSILTAYRIAVALLGVPVATAAQRDLNGKPYGYTREKANNVGAVSRFGNRLASSLDDMPGSMLAGYPDRFLARARNLLGARLDQPVFTDAEFRAKIAGARPEVAVVRALKATAPDGLTFGRTNTLLDMQGVDIIVGDDEGREIYIDTKAHDSFDHTLDQDFSLGYITGPEYEAAKQQGYWRQREPSNRTNRVRLVVDSELFGPMNETGFEYEHPEAVTDFLLEQLQIASHATTLRRVGNSAINS